MLYSFMEVFIFIIKANIDKILIIDVFQPSIDEFFYWYVLTCFYYLKMIKLRF